MLNCIHGWISKCRLLYSDGQHPWLSEYPYSDCSWLAAIGFLLTYFSVWLLSSNESLISTDTHGLSLGGFTGIRNSSDVWPATASRLQCTIIKHITVFFKCVEPIFLFLPYQCFSNVPLCSYKNKNVCSAYSFSWREGRLLVCLSNTSSWTSLVHFESPECPPSQSCGSDEGEAGGKGRD